mmetsp:Transcript_3415/g.9464  ORF Transcript_3415/g.9464 Transcript_3415/m.9464 type:complete len:93 (+) Transcript_3415:830-1108(+)
MIQLTQGHGIIEHMPVHAKNSFQNYKRTYKKHSQHMKNLGREVDEEFWPEPPETFEASSLEDGNYSDHGKVTGWIRSETKSWSKSSGCGGCG